VSVLSRYFDPEVLSQIADRPFEPRGLVQGNLAGAHKSPQSGFAVEFQGHREYVPGDDPRHIDWRVYYLRDKYFVKQYEMETNLVCHLLLDVSASMRYGEGPRQKLMYAAKVATALAYCILRLNDKVSLGTFDQQVRGYSPPSNSLQQIVKITDHLQQIQPVEKTDVAASLNDLAGRMGRREIVMILSDLFCDLDRLDEVIQRLRFLKHEVVLLHIMDHDELHFSWQGAVKFIGLESADQLLANPEDLRPGYLAALRRFQDRVDEIVYRNRCERVLMDTSRSIRDVLSDYLNRRGVQVRTARSRFAW
jgi:uncharacterized protein (DUF58 family)